VSQLERNDKRAARILEAQAKIAQQRRALALKPIARAVRVALASWGAYYPAEKKA
jgi:hypothetical protein